MMNHYARKRQHKKKMKQRMVPYRYASLADYYANADERELEAIEHYWKLSGWDRWWNISGGRGSYKDSVQKLANDKEKAFWRQQIHRFMEDPEYDIPIWRPGQRIDICEWYLW